MPGERPVRALAPLRSQRKEEVRVPRGAWNGRDEALGGRRDDKTDLAALISWRRNEAREVSIK